jgi:hypothetical protein
VRAASHCAQMEAAAVSGIPLCERRQDGTVLITIQQTTSQEQASAAESLLQVRGVASAVTAN